MTCSSQFWIGRLRLRRLPALAAALVLVTLAVATGTAQAASPRMVALGDSYASGVGTRSYDSSSGSCQRSPYAYSVLDAARIGASLSFQACSGATTTAVKDNQLATLSGATTYVTLTVGGNDAGFSSVLTECSQPWWSSNCNDAIDKAQAFIANTLPSRLDTLYAAIRTAAPHARIVVAGYPRIFNGEDCNAGTWFSPSEETRLNQTADQLDAAIKKRAAAYAYAFVDPRAAFVGHAVCDNPEWINGLSNPVSESYHPNRSGQAGYADLVDDFLT